MGRDRIRIATLALLGTLLTGCQTTGSGELTSEQKRASIAEGDCFRRAAAKLDDGTSDATTVAVGVVSACSPEEQKLESAMSAGHSLYYATSMSAGLQRMGLETATEIVLLHRKETRGGGYRMPPRRRPVDGLSPPEAVWRPSCGPGERTRGPPGSGSRREPPPSAFLRQGGR
jgi:hypothetical protein